MKAYSTELEIELTISKDELKKLKTGKLESILNFRYINSSENKKIPISLTYIPGKSVEVDVKHSPETVYLGDAHQIDVSIQDYPYQMLEELGYWGNRFWHNGKVEIVKEN